MKSKWLFLLMLFLSLPVLAVDRMPVGTQFHLTGGTRTAYSDCVGSCIFMETAAGTTSAHAITPNAGLASNYISNIIINPPPQISFFEKIGTADIFVAPYDVMAYRATGADVAYVLPSRSCSDMTTPCTPFATVYFPIYLKRISDGHEFVIGNAMTNQAEFHISEYWKQGDNVYMVVTGIWIDRHCTGGNCGWPQNAKVQLRLYGQLTTAAMLPAINGVSGNYQDAIMIAYGDNLSTVTRAQVNGVDKPFYIQDKNTLVVFKPMNTTLGVLTVTSPAGISQYPEVFKTTY